MDPKILQNISASLAQSAPVGPSSTLLSGSVYGSNIDDPVEVIKKESDEDQSIFKELLSVNQSMLTALTAMSPDGSNDGPDGKGKEEDSFSLLNAAITAAAAGAIAFSDDIAKAVGSVKETFNNVKDNVKETYDNIVEETENIVDKTSDKFTKLGDNIVSVVKGEKSVSEVITDDTVEFKAGSTAMGEGGMRGTALKVKQSKQKDELDRAKADLEEARAAGKTGKAITFRERNVAALQKDYDQSFGQTESKAQVQQGRGRGSILNTGEGDPRVKSASAPKPAPTPAPTPAPAPKPEPKVEPKPKANRDEYLQRIKDEGQSQESIQAAIDAGVLEMGKDVELLQGSLNLSGEMKSEVEENYKLAPEVRIKKYEGLIEYTQNRIEKADAAKQRRESKKGPLDERQAKAFNRDQQNRREDLETFQKELEQAKMELSGGGGTTVVNNVSGGGGGGGTQIVPMSTSPRPGSKGSPLERHIGQSTVY